MHGTADSIDSLEQALAGLVAESARLLGLTLPILRRLDTAQVAGADGCRTFPEWVASRLDVTHDFARDLVAVARAADDGLEADLLAGSVTWDRAVAVTGLKAAGADEGTVGRSSGFDLAGVERLTAGFRHLTAVETRRTASDRFLAVQPALGGGLWKMWGQVPAADGHVIEKALLARADTFPPEPVPVPRTARMADALTAVCADSLVSSSGDGPDRSALTADVFVDAGVASASRGERGASLVSGPRVGPDTLAEILCAGSVRVVVEESGSAPASSVRSRTIPSATRAAVLRRDQMVCTVDGCRSRYRLQPHHIRPYAAGGDHDSSNLTTVCWYHHHIVIHTLGFSIDPLSPPGRRRFTPPP